MTRFAFSRLVRVCSTATTTSPSRLSNMSSSEEENFDMDVSGSESEDYAPAPKKKVPAKPKPASKPAPKAKAAPKKKVLVDKDDNADTMDAGDSGDEEIGGPSEPAPAATNGKKKTASETYQKVSVLVAFVLHATTLVVISSSRNWNTFSSDLIRILGAWSISLSKCGFGTARTNG